MSDDTPASRPDPIRPTDDEARSLARSLIAASKSGVIGVIDPATGEPHVSRVAVGLSGGAPLLLVSMLALHTRALIANPACSLLLGEPGARGDPLVHPRLTLVARAERADKPAERDGWLANHPKTKLYFDLSDFLMFRLMVREAHLNGGFGRAFRLTQADLNGL